MSSARRILCIIPHCNTNHSKSQIRINLISKKHDCLIGKSNIKVATLELFTKVVLLQITSKLLNYIK